MKFFAFAVVSLFGSAAAVASGKAKAAAEGALSSDKPASPWLSLLAKSWALPGEPQQEQSKGLDSLASSIIALAKSHKNGAPDAEMQAAIDSISQILADMKDAVKAANDAAQKELGKKLTAITTCSAPNMTDSSDFQATLKITAGEVNSCRSSYEKYVYDEYKTCVKEEGRCSNTTECCVDLIQPNPYCLNPPSAPSPLSLQTECDGAAKCREKDIANKLGFFENKLKEYNDAVTACDLSRAGCNNSYACEPKKTLWKERQSECNNNQTVFEQAYCDLAEKLEASWEVYSTCHTRSVTALTTEEGKQKKLLTGRHQEWRGLLRIECLLSALKETDQTAALEACIKKNVTSVAEAALNLTLPSEAGEVPAVSKCSEKLYAPGTTYFLSSFYSGTPAELMPSSLTTFHCVSGLSTTHCPLASTSLSMLSRGKAFRHPIHHIK